MRYKFPVWLHLLCLCIIRTHAEGPAGLDSLSLIRQDFTVEFTNYTYRFNIEVGTPPQMLTVNADFGSADLIINPGENFCSVGCNWQGLYTDFNANSSKTLQFNNSYVSTALSSDGSSLYGVWARDSVKFGNLGSVQVNNTSFVYRDSVTYIATDAAENTLGTMPNIFGLGPRGLEACVQWLEADGSPGPTYNNLLNSMEGIRSAFSIWVDPVTLSRGTIVFGGIDESLYVPGSLHSVPIANPPGSYMDLLEPIYLAIPFYEFSATVKVDSTPWITNSWYNGGSVAILNSRSRFSLPVSLLEGIGKLLSAEWASSEGMYIVRCDLEGAFALNFGPTSLNISVAEHLVPIQAVDKNGVPLCGLNIGESDQVYLSNLILKNCFIAVDYVKREIAFGEPANGASMGQPQDYQYFNDSIDGMTATDTRSENRIFDPAFFILTTRYSSVAIHGPEFFSSQTTQFLLGSQPVPSIMNTHNISQNIIANTGTDFKKLGSSSGPPSRKTNALFLTINALVISIYLLV